MKIRVEFLIVTIIFAGFFQNLWSMEGFGLPKGYSQDSYLTSKPKSPREPLKGFSEESFLRGSHPDKKHAPKPESFFLKIPEKNSPPQSPRRGSSPNRGGSPKRESQRLESPRKSPRKPYHSLWFFGQDGISMQRVDLEFFGSPSWEKLCCQLKSHNVQVFIWITAQDINTLDVDCEGVLTSRLKEIKIDEALVHPETVEKFFDEMKRNSGKIIVVYGASNNSKIYEMLVYWAIPIIIEYAMSRDDNIVSSDKQCCINDILRYKTESQTIAKALLEQLANYILQLTYQRVLPNVDKLSYYLSEEVQANIKKYCLNNLEMAKSRVMCNTRSFLSEKF